MGSMIEIVDVGAADIDDRPCFVNLLLHKLCTITGFDPQRHLLRPDTVSYPWVIGNGEDRVLTTYAAPGLTSTRELDPKVCALFYHFDDWGKIVKTEKVKTRRLDDLDEIPRIDFLKMDVQGGELDVITGGKIKLASALFVQTEVSFLPLYMGQPLFGQVDAALRDLGFLFHTFTQLDRRTLRPYLSDAPWGQIIGADAVYVRDITQLDVLTESQLEHMALIAEHCFGSVDLADKCRTQIRQRAAA